MEDLLLPFITVLLAEMGDKTQLAIFCLALRSRSRLQLLISIISAFIVADGIAVILGDFLAKFIPNIKSITGIVFILCGIAILFKQKSKEENECAIGEYSFLSGFGLMLISEMGDKTQLVSGLFATKYDPLLVFIGAVSALALLSTITIYLGKYIVKRIDERTVSKVAAIIFILIGLASFIS